MNAGTALRNALLDLVETFVSTAPKLQIRTGAAPASAGAADSGILIFEVPCPADWANDAASAMKTFKGTWQATALADNAGTGLHWRLKDNAGTVTHLQGTVSVTGGGGELQVNTLTILTGAVLTITAFTQTAGNP